MMVLSVCKSILRDRGFIAVCFKQISFNCHVQFEPFITMDNIRMQYKPKEIKNRKDFLVINY